MYQIKKSVRFVHNVSRSLLNIMLGPLERRINLQYDLPQKPPIFIIGPARSGTTLVYQSIVYSTQVSYFSNAIALIPEFPSISTSLLSKFNGCNPPKLFNSKYGKTRGWHSPSQGDQIWSRWFPKKSGEGIVHTDNERKQMTGTVSCIEKKFKGPFVAKWPGFSIYISHIAKLFPNAVFIWVQRDSLQNVQSVLKGRYELTGDPHVSFSRVPESYIKYNNSNYIQQVCAYVLGVEEQINKDIQKIGRNKCFNIQYEDFCKDPKESLNKFIQWYYDKTGFLLKIRNDDLPNSFTVSNSQKLSSEKVDALAKTLSEMEKDFDR